MTPQTLRDEVRLAVVGCGGFGLFALQHFAQAGVKLVGMAGTHRPAALAAARRFGIPDVEDVAALVRRDDVDLVYIATPPFLHHPQAMMALEAGKHVVCEKPLALTVAQADEMIDTARRNGRLLVANLMQRYNPRTSRPTTGSGTARKAAASSSSTASISSICSTAGWDPAGWRPLSVGVARVLLSRSRSSVRSATATPAWSTSTTASTSPGAWTGRRCGSCSSAAT